jgi:lipoprotein NlpI
MKSSILFAFLLILLSWEQISAAEPTAGPLQQALADLNKQLALDPKQAEAYHERGCVHFKLGDFNASVKDFDTYIELVPARKAGHWQRGISCYYAGLYDEGRKQFEGYQSTDSNDVENAVWRYMCMAKAMGAARARREMLKIGDDRRVPMRQVYELFSGKLKAADVLAAACVAPPGGDDVNKEVSNRQLFYAHLYLGIYYDLEGQGAAALTHLKTAADEYRINHYMWDVARIHRDLLKKSLKNKEQ